MLAAGCGTPPPCNVKPAQIETARREATAVGEAGATDEAAARAELEQAIAAHKLAIKAAADSSAERAALEQRLAELKQGSGR